MFISFEGSACATAQWHNGQSKIGWWLLYLSFTTCWWNKDVYMSHAQARRRYTIVHARVVEHYYAHKTASMHVQCSKKRETIRYYTI